MNGTPGENQKRKAEGQRMAELVEDFQRADPVLLKDAQDLTCAEIRKHLPTIKGFAVQSGNMKGKLTIELLFDLTPKKKKVEVRAIVQPQPVTSFACKEVEY